MLLFSMAYGLLAMRIPLSFMAQQEFFTSRTMPYALAAIGFVLSLLILVLPTVDKQGKTTLAAETRGMDWRRAILLVIAMIIYGLVMKWIGFIIASVLFLMLGFYILGERSFKKMALAAIPLVILLWFIMSALLGVYIAPGELFYMLGIL